MMSIELLDSLVILCLLTVFFFGKFPVFLES